MGTAFSHIHGHERPRRNANMHSLYVKEETYV